MSPPSVPASPASARFQLISGNRLDALAARLGERLARPPEGVGDDDLRPETVLIPQPALRHWLLQALAERHGIAANLDVRTLTDLVWALLRAHAPALPEASPWDPERLRWPLYALLSDVDAPLPPAVREHLRRAGVGEGTGAALSRFALATQVAQAFDRYLGYRADWLADWDAGAEREDWQAALWRLLRRRMGDTPHRAALIADWLRRHDREGVAGAGAIRPPGLPSRLSAFGTLHVPPDQLRMLAVAAQWCEVDFYLPTPCAEYWGDVESLRARLREDGPDALPAALAAFQADNPLLSAWGAGGREIVAQLFSYETVLPEREIEAFVAPGRARLLHRLQQDVLDRAASREEGPLADDEDSLQIHACHSRLREVEVLHDRLRAMLDPDSPEGRRFDPPLQPREIAVMAPDIGAYLPLARAVFGGWDTDDPRYIPFSLADRPQVQSHPLLPAFLGLLDLADTPLRAGAFGDLLAVPAIAQAQGLDAAALARIGQWCEAAGIRWGEDAEARVRAGAGRWREYSFDFGFDRLLAGYAAGGDALLPSAGGDGLPLAPYPELEGGDAELLDRALSVYRRLRALAAWMRSAHSAQDWALRLAQDILGLLGPVPADGAEAQARQRLLDALDGFAIEAAQADDAGLPAEVVRKALRERLLQPPRQQPWLSGGVTFAGMVPLRTVPFRVICLLGLDAEAFPRRDSGAEIQRTVDALQGRAPRRLGDRSVREDDRFLFLQLLCAAGEVFYLSYGGRDARDGSVREPSPLLTELLDTVARMHGADAPQRLRLDHPLQPFSAAAFGPVEDGPVEDGPVEHGPGEGPRGAAHTALSRFSYRADWGLPPTAVAAPRAPPPFVPAALVTDASVTDESVTGPSAEVAPEAPDREALQAFFANPARIWLREGLGVRLGERARSVDDDEPLGEDGLLRHTVLRALLAQADANADMSADTNADMSADTSADAETAADRADNAQIARVLRARAALPPGRDGEALVAEAQPLAQQMRRAARSSRGAAVPAERCVQAQTPVAFGFGDVWQDAAGALLRVLVEPGKPDGKRLLRAGLDHLLLASVCGTRARTVLVLERERKTAKDKREQAPALALQAATLGIEDARRRLRRLVSLHRAGLRQPLAFAPKAAWAYYKTYRETTAPDGASDPAQAHVRAWAAARDAFAPSHGDFGERHDPWLALAFRPDGLFDAPDSARAAAFARIARAVFDALPEWSEWPLPPDAHAVDEHATGEARPASARKRPARKTARGDASDARARDRDGAQS